MKALIVGLLLLFLRPSEAQEWRLRVVGGLTFGREWTPILRREGPEYPFREIAPFLRDADLTIGFLEGPLATVGEPMPGVKEPLRSSPLVARALRSAGFDAVSLAGPHIRDFGVQALLATEDVLEAEGIVHFGAGINDTLSRMTGFLVVGDVSVAALGYLHGLYAGQAGQHVAGANPALLSVIREDVARAHERADVVLVFFHWGGARDDTVDSRQRLFARIAIEAGATAVFGLRDQSWQGAEAIRGRPVLYSLGDFVRRTGGKRVGRLLIPTVIFDGSEPVRVEWSPVRVDAAIGPDEDWGPKLQPRLISREDARAAIQTFTAFCRALGTDLRATATGVALDLKGRQSAERTP